MNTYCKIPLHISHKNLTFLFLNKSYIFSDCNYTPLSSIKYIKIKQLKTTNFNKYNFYRYILQIKHQACKVVRQTLTAFVWMVYCRAEHYPQPQTDLLLQEMLLLFEIISV